MRADPVSDVIHSKRPDTCDLPDLAFNKRMKGRKVGCLG
jgi:hypothetical protein